VFYSFITFALAFCEKETTQEQSQLHGLPQQPWDFRLVEG
jgi:hypothetical protein